MEPHQTVRVFKAGNRSKTWSAELAFDDGTTTTILTPHVREKSARMYGVQKWRTLLKAKLLLDKEGASKRPRVPRVPRATNGLVGHSSAELERMVNGLNRPAASSLQRVIGALAKVASAVEGLTPDELSWVFSNAVNFTNDAYLASKKSEHPKSEHKGTT